LATSVAVSTEIPTSAPCSASASFDTVAEEADRTAGATQRDDQPRLLLRRDPGEDGVVLRRIVERIVVEGLHLGAGDRAFGCQTQVGADFFGNLRIIASSDLDLNAQGGQLCQRIARGGFGLVGEHQKPVEPQARLVARVDGGQPRCRPTGHRHHTSAVGEERRQRLLRGVGHRHALGQHLLGCTLHQEHAAPVVIEHT